MVQIQRSSRIVARFRKCSDLVREGKEFVTIKTEVASGVGCSETAVVCFREYVGKKNKGDNHMMTVGCDKPESFLLA